MKINERNKQIHALRKQGKLLREIGQTFGISADRVGVICREMDALAKELPVPAGLSLRTAKAIHLAFGVWPGPETAMDIAGRKGEWLRAHGIGRKQYLELEAWTKSAAPEGATDQ